MKRNRWKLLTLLIAAVVLITTVTLSVYAYFSTRVYVYTDDGKEVAHLGMNLQLLFGKLKPGNVQDAVYDEDGNVTTLGAPLKIPYYEKDSAGHNIYHEGGDTDSPTFDSTKPWGSPQNPYIIANERHLQNLSALQNIGYFDLMYISENFNEDGTYNNGISMPYFLVCDENGEPAVIDASEIGTIKPVGSAEHPFIGVVGGAFVEGDTYIDTNRNEEKDEGEKTTTVSAFHNVKVQTTTDQTDVGLFGYVGYLGTEPTENIGTVDNPVYETQFAGATSILQNFLLSDVQVIVKDPSLAEKLSEFFGEIWKTVFKDSNNHRFSYTNSGETNPPKEDHHIGILAGHVSYATVENISVYYSSNSIYAIDVTHANKNYYTESGILGFMYNMNADVKNVMDENNTAQYADHCLVMMGTGTSADDMEIPVAGSGSGTGGGLESGSGRGYVTAAEIFSQFNNVNTSAPNNELLWNYQPASGGLVKGAILIFKHPTNGKYYFADGETEATISGNTVSDSNNNSWDSFFILERQDTEEITYSYKTPSGDPIASIEPAGNLINGKEVWKYQAGGDGIWHYGVRINFDGTSYKLADGGEAVTIDTNVRPVKPTATVGDTAYTFENFFVVDTRTNEAYIFDPFEAGTTVKVTSFNHKPLELIDGVTADGTTKLCEEWMRERLLGFLGFSKEASGMYYFYDGVFTFALSSMDDTITDTWENDQAPTLHLGANDPAAWTNDPSTGNKAVVALLTPVTDNATLDRAIAEGKQIYISAKTDNTGLNTTLMSLPGGLSGGDILSLENDLSESLRQSYASGEYTDLPKVPLVNPTTGLAIAEQDMANVTVSDLANKAFWSEKNYTILNIGRTGHEVNLQTLRQQYNVAATKQNGEYQYFNYNTGAYIEPSGATLTEYLSWDGYFYYTCDEGVFQREQGEQTGTSWGRPVYRWTYWTEFTFTFYYQPKQNVAPITLGTTTYRAGETSVESANAPTEGLWYRKEEFSTTYAEAASAEFLEVDTAYTYTVGDTERSLQRYRYKDSNMDVDERLLEPKADVTTEWVTTSSAPMIYFDESDGSVIAHGTVPSSVLTTEGSILSISEVSVSKNYYYQDAVTGDYYLPDSTTPIEDTTPYATWIRLLRYPCYNFFSNASTEATKSYLQILNEVDRWIYKDWDWYRGSNYSIWSGTDSQYSDLMRDANKSGVLVFDTNTTEDDPFCYIRYGLHSTTYYVGYNAETNRFEGKTNRTQATKLYVYVIEGLIDMDYGYNTFIPTTSDPALEFAADEYVFWPQYTLTNTGYSTNTGYGSDPTKVESNTINAANAVSTDPVYRLTPLQGEGGLNWGSANGYLLGKEYGLHQKFQMQDQAGFGTMVNILGGNLELNGSYGEYSMLVAPIGSNGVEATIPKGCVAFRVNTDKTETVRVIVAVPATHQYIGEDKFNLDLAQDYYIGVWNVAAANEDWTFSFDKSDALEKFEIPRSYPFSTDSLPEDVEAVPQDATYKNYVDVSYDSDGDGTSEQYRSYLNGDCFLVAYEFTVSGEGVYVIGSVHGTNNTDSTKDAAMEIVHFSVSGTASAGRDGIAGSKLGSVDFVYDQNDAIVTVDKTGLTGGLTNAAGNENYANYYASQCLLHTKNSVVASEADGVKTYHLINDVRIAIQRYVATDTNGNGVTTIAYSVGPPESTQKPYVIVDEYMTNADTVVRTEETS